MFFYFDNIIKSYEENHDWDKSLEYLERTFNSNLRTDVLCSLVGFSWYYFVEGGVESHKYLDDDKNNEAIIIWKKYIRVGKDAFSEDPYFNFIAGYTIGLHGFFINESIDSGDVLMNKCISLSSDTYLKQLAEFWLELKARRIKKNGGLPKPVKGKEICEHLFSGGSLLEKYFNELYCTK